MPTPNIVATATPHRYSVRMITIGTRGNWPKLEGKILEGTVWVGTFSRKTQERNYVPPITYKFFSQGARARFEDFADSLSIEETIEALLPRTAMRRDTVYA